MLGKLPADCKRLIIERPRPDSRRLQVVIEETLHLERQVPLWRKQCAGKGADLAESKSRSEVRHKRSALLRLRCAFTLPFALAFAPEVPYRR